MRPRRPAGLQMVSCRHFGYSDDEAMVDSSGCSHQSLEKLNFSDRSNEFIEL